ncbi:MAG: DUF2961 domain-containing protein [Pirellulales bacterium]|nr:DUF2961 domain-containing protein [Pirellulales bacterium]
MMLRFRVLLPALFVWGGIAISDWASAQDQLLELAAIRPQSRAGFANAGWTADRYPHLPTLDAKKSMLMADLEGPGVIRAIHTTRHHQRELSARGVVLVIYFDDAAEPAVHCPLADFFGDGCNGGSMNFSTNFIECAPGSYNAYFPMPFQKRAKIFLRNDTDKNFSNYSFVEWEKLPAWKKEYGYFHATYQRKCFQLGPKTAETFLELLGSGQLIGRQFSVVTEEPLYKDFNYVMEGNNEVDIDGQKRAIDYLGSEDSFTFSWGFQTTFAGLRAGMPLVQSAGPSKLSIYRFHDHQPIRFNKSLRWTIDWSTEGCFKSEAAKLSKIAAEGGSWVDYATVHYWYQDQPGGYKHKELESVADRMKLILSPPKK